MEQIKALGKHKSTEYHKRNVAIQENLRSSIRIEKGILLNISPRRINVEYGVTSGWNYIKFYISVF